jgi:peptidoglycan/LPS O-acetylase OafA/YrhL
VRVRQFYARRVLRIWPLYYLALVIGFFVAPVLFGQAGTPAHAVMISDHLLAFATLFANVSTATRLASLNAMTPSSDTLSVLWTIALEEQFYLVFPLLLLAVRRPVGLQIAVPCALVVLAVAVGARFYILATGIPYPMVWMNTLAHLDPIVLGIVGAVVWHRHRSRVLRLRLFGADALLAVGAFWLVMSFPQIGASWHTIWQILAVAVGSLLLIFATLRYRPLGSIFGCRPIAWLGRISYGLYIFHLPAKQLYQFWLAASLPLDLLHGPIRWLTEFSLVLLLTIAIAAVSYYGFEKRFLQYKERFAVIRSRPA